MACSCRHVKSEKRIGTVWGILPVKAFVAVLAALLFTGTVSAQSTFGTIVGTVKDAAANVLPRAEVLLSNRGTSASRTAVADPTGNYSFNNLEPGSYQLLFEAPGFEKVQIATLDLQARETKRVDVQLKISTQTESIDVVESGGAEIETDVSNIAETKTGRELVDLPVAITSHSAGSTSPISTLTTQPGVQTDSAGNISVSGTKPSLLSISVDGISTMAINGSSPINELFPAFSSIAEIRVSEVNNSAEYGGITDITTVSKAGSNAYHGGLFENHENAALNAGNPFAKSKPALVMNDFGGFFGGPLSIPHLYNGHNKTFFFVSYEGLRLPRQVPVVESVPTDDMRNGNLCGYLASKSIAHIYQPNGTEIPCGSVPINPVAANVLQYLYPHATDQTKFANNYQHNFAAPIASDQGDIRIDQVLTSKQTIWARGMYKFRSVLGPAISSGNYAGSPVLGSYSTPEQDIGFTVAYNYVITPTLVNEIRGGFTGNQLGFSNPNPVSQSTVIAADIGIQGLYPLPGGNAVPNFQIAGFQSTGGTGTASRFPRNHTDQILETLTWSKEKHTLKFGADYRYMTEQSTNVFATNRQGIYVFDGSVTKPIIKDTFAAFLQGVPDSTQLASVIQPDLQGYAGHWAFFGQDDWKVNSKLTLNFGLRWEYHPMFRDHLLNVTNFLPDYYSVINGQTVRGAVVIPNQAAFSILNPGFVTSIAPTPILTAAQVGLPEGMRTTQKSSFAPRFGFAWRPFGNDKTVIRGGYGKYIEALLGALISAQYGVHTADNEIYSQSINGGVASLTFPSPFGSKGGTQNFQQAQQIHYRDPYVQEWNLTIERDLGFGTALRVSYDGNHATDLSVAVDYNQVPANTIGYAQANLSRPFPAWGKLQTVVNGATANYQAATIEAQKRFSRGLQFQSSYTFAKNLSNEAGGGPPTAFAGENGGLMDDSYNLGIDYGNVAYTRRNRFLSTFLYELPLGQGKALLNKRGVVDTVFGGWEVAGVMLFQSGPFLTVGVPGADPSGTGFTTRCQCNGRPDFVPGVSPYAANQTVGSWLNPAAFAVPANNIGRFGTATVGSLQGPGTQAVSLSLIKTIKFTESARVQIGAEASNLLNHANFAPPNTTLTTSSFGKISALQSAEGAGPRSVQLTARISF
jgi:Carboxypeptidase regulatory-like domain/TonB dependent receptor-like, beta-barrel